MWWATRRLLYENSWIHAYKSHASSSICLRTCLPVAEVRVSTQTCRKNPTASRSSPKGFDTICEAFAAAAYQGRPSSNCNCVFGAPLKKGVLLIKLNAACGGTMVLIPLTPVPFFTPTHPPPTLIGLCFCFVFCFFFAFFFCLACTR